MSDQDFVERLRIRWEAMGDMANSERAAAADEIEFLRRSQRELMGQVSALRETLRIVNDNLEERTAESGDLDDLRERMVDILTRTANALHGGYAPPDCLHSWHDLPELVEKLRKERDEARRMWCEVIWLQGGLIPPTLAADKGWDCYKRKAQ